MNARMEGKHRTIIAVLGSGTDAVHARLAEQLGRWIATQGHDLLTGGGGGVMRIVAGAFGSYRGPRGISIGIIPGSIDADGRYRPKDGYPNDDVELPIYTHLPLSGDQGSDAMSRNHINVLTADVIVILPGGAGTRSEAILAQRYGKPMILFGPRDAFADFPPARRTDDFNDVTSFIVQELGK